MSRIDFPYDAESDHPQYKWNAQEFFIRMLHQNRIGVQLYEHETGWTISLDPSVSLNTIAYGGADFKNIAAPITRDLGVFILPICIYIRADGSAFYTNFERPKYNNYLHGWYRGNGDRCVAFVDPSQPQKHRVVLMDSFNAPFEYNQFVSSVGGDIVYNSIQGTTYFSKDGDTVILNPGKYRIVMRGGKGGNGGNVTGNRFLSPSYPSATEFFTGRGGEGSVAKTYTFKLVVHNRVTLKAWVGKDGGNGENSITLGHQDYPLNTYNYAFTSAGGGSSGMDTYLLFTNGVLLFEAIGGAGGGGAYIIASERRQIDTTGGTTPIARIGSWQCSGPGGGGAGSTEEDDSNDGQVMNIGYKSTATPGPSGGYNQPVPAQGGKIDNGGTGSVGTESTAILYDQPVFNYDSNLKGKNGQDRGNLRRRDGGNSGTIRDKFSLGGKDVIDNVTGFLTIYRTGDV